MLINHSVVPTSISARIRIPESRNRAVVPMHEATMGNSDSHDFASHTPMPTLSNTKINATQRERLRIAASERPTDTAELAQAVGLPSNQK